MIKRTLFTTKPEMIDHYFTFETELGQQEACELFNQDFGKSLEQGLDLVILGIGPDGHFASIFPGTDLMNRQVAEKSSTEQFAVKERLSLSAQTILKSKKIIILIAGAAKKELINKINTESATNFPAAILKTHHDCTVFFWEG